MLFRVFRLRGTPNEEIWSARAEGLWVGRGGGQDREAGGGSGHKLQADSPDDA